MKTIQAIWKQLLMLLVCILPLLTGVGGLGQASAQAAAADQVTVTLHKKKMDEFPTHYMQNTGQVMSEFDRYAGLNGVAFKAYDITATFYAQLETTLAKLPSYPNYSEQEREQAVRELMAGAYHFEATDTKNSLKDTQTTATVDAEDGIAQFKGLEARDPDNGYKVYYFEEELGTTAADYQAQPLILSLPVLDEKQADVADIHLYPKNKVANEPEKDLLDENGDPRPPHQHAGDYYDYEIGKAISYRARFMIPNQIGEILTAEETGEEVATRYAKLTFKDQMSHPYLRFHEIEKVTIGGTEVPLADLLAHGAITYTNKDTVGNELAGFELKMNLNEAEKQSDPTNFDRSKAAAAYLGQYAGQMIEFTYTVSLTDQTPIDEAIDNEFTINLRRHGETDDEERKIHAPEVGTGGHRFIKHAQGDQKEVLKGAEFVLLKEIAGQVYYLKEDRDPKGQLQWQAVGTAETYADAKRYVSDAAGKFEVSGLAFGEYQVREIKAPKGFQKLGDVAFTVEKGSYSESELLYISNTKKGFLPSTGGPGILLFLAIGSMLIMGAIVKYRRLQHDTH